MTPAEKELWKYLRGRQFRNIKFRRQFGVGPYILDFYAPENKLCIELDGSSHFEKDAVLYDEERTIFLESQGINVVRYTNLDIYENIEGVFENLAHHIKNTPPNLP